MSYETCLLHQFSLNWKLICNDWITTMTALLLGPAQISAAVYWTEVVHDPTPSNDPSAELFWYYLIIVITGEIKKVKVTICVKINVLIPKCVNIQRINPNMKYTDIIKSAQLCYLNACSHF